jgi:Tn3 transposase DDE domain
LLVSRCLRNALAAGDVSVQESTEFRRCADDLISDTRWQDKAAVLHEIGAPIVLAPIDETRAAVRDTLDAKLTAVHPRMEAGTHTHLKGTVVAGKRRWRRLYPSAADAVNSPFYSQLPGIGIAALWWCVAAQTGCLRACTHVLERYVKHAPEPRALLACVGAMGTNMG